MNVLNRFDAYPQNQNQKRHCKDISFIMNIMIKTFVFNALIINYFENQVKINNNPKKGS